MEINAEILRKLQLAQLVTFLEIKRICDKHHIRYTPIGGTLIGTVRHHGFIPWDDDIDLGMLREDYDRFYEIAKSELNPEFFLQTYETDPGYPHPIMRICINNTLCVEDFDKNRDMHHGIYTDIFPYDASPNNKMGVFIHKYMIMFLKLSNFDRNGEFISDSFKIKLLLKLIRLSTIMISDEKIGVMLRNQITRYNSKNADYVVRTGSQYAYEKVRIPRKLMDESITMDFEGFPISVMHGYHEHLSQNYGDYMKLPPEDKRNKAFNSIVDLDLGKYDDIDYIKTKLDEYR